MSKNGTVATSFELSYPVVESVRFFPVQSE
jgi:hypothetical protein